VKFPRSPLVQPHWWIIVRTTCACSSPIACRRCWTTISSESSIRWRHVLSLPFFVDYYSSLSFHRRCASCCKMSSKKNLPTSLPKSSISSPSKRQINNSKSVLLHLLAVSCGCIANLQPFFLQDLIFILGKLLLSDQGSISFPFRSLFFFH
jgi:hypothetical protein